MNRELSLQAKTIHEAIDEQIRRESLKPKPVKALFAPVLAQAHTAIYKMHRYYARRPHNVFSKIIEHYTNPGDIILDPFSGGGVTVVEGLKLRRRVIGVDINPLATWVTQVEAEPADLDRLDELYRSWYAAIKRKVNSLFKAKCGKCGNYGVAEWFQWSNVVVCPYCGHDTILGKTKKIRAGTFECQFDQCRARLEPSKCSKKEDVLLRVSVMCTNCEKMTLRDAIADDIERYKKLARREKSLIKREKLSIPSDKFPDMDRARDDNIFGRGIRYFKDFMTVRQQIAVARIKKCLPKTKKGDNEVNALHHVFSASLRYTNKFVFQSENWQGGKPIEWAGHNYWLPFNYLELNPLTGIEKRYKAVRSGKNEQSNSIGRFYQSPRTREPWAELMDGATCWLLTQSSHELRLPDKCVDAIITDPPFGGNVQYGELSDFFLVWTKDLIGVKGVSEKSQEAIETRNQGFEGAKDREFYENMLFQVFQECRRVVRDDGWLVLTFHNRDIGVWMSLHRAALRAGFRLPSEKESNSRGMLYQPPVKHYTYTIHQRAAGSMLGDFILSFRPVEPQTQLLGIKSQLSLEEEKKLQRKAEQIIRYHGGADETTLMTGLVPYLYEQSLLHRIAKYDLKILLENGPFVYLPKEKRWYTKEMVGDSGEYKAMDRIPAEALVERLVHSYLSEHKRATMDELLVTIYTQLVNSDRPQISTIEKVVSRYCKRMRVKGQKRNMFVWNPSAVTTNNC